MSKVRQNFTKILDGLSFQHVSNNLGLVEKVNVLSDSVVFSKSNQNVVQIPVKNKSARVAMLCNGCSGENALNYLIDHAKDSTIDILCHGEHKDNLCDCYKDARQQLIENNMDVRILDFINASYSDIKQFLLNQTALKFLVADYDDKVLKNFLKQNHVNYPIVLIGS